MCASGKSTKALSAIANTKDCPAVEREGEREGEEREMQETVGTA
jgi:hypothetical protein